MLAKNRILKSIPSKMSASEKSLAEAQSALDGQRGKYEASEKKKREKERELDDMGERIKKLRARTAEIKDNKAYQAHISEIEAAEKSGFAIEDEILLLMEAVDEEKKRIKTAEAALEAEKKKAGELKKELEAEMKEAEKELEAVKSRRKELAAPIEADYYKLYMTVLQNKKGLAVVEASGEICRGCNMNIMPQLFVELKKNEQIMTCPQCGRILYYVEKQESAPSN